MTEYYDVAIIGGGATGLGTARDCAMRGLKTVLVEMSDIATGASGRNHGLLHSGARYAVKDGESAAECIKENKILKLIASHCVEDCGGLFITLREDTESGFGLDYQRTFINACLENGIKAERIEPREALEMEPVLSGDIIGAVKVPDASVDPFRLCGANMYDALMRGAKILTYTRVEAFIREGDAITGMELFDTCSGHKWTISAGVIINAAGIWGEEIARKAGVEVKLFPSKGSLLVYSHRVSKMVINRCRKPSDGDILVPGDTVCVLGTTSTRVPFEECGRLRVTRDEVELLSRQGSFLAPSLETTRILRAYAGVRPLVAAENDPTGRSLSRGIVCLDHEKRDGLRGFVTITGGKLTTYRLMAQIVTDVACEKLDSRASCTTHLSPIIDPMVPRHSSKDGDFICDCEKVSREDLEWAVDKLGAVSMEDVRRRTRIGMGTCQGTYCVRKASKILANRIPSLNTEQCERKYIAERWKGMCPVGWGCAIREMEFMQKVFKFGAPFSFNDDRR